MGNILVCDDEQSVCTVLDIALRRDGYKVETVCSGQAAKAKIDSALFDVIITDIKMPNTDGIDVLKHAHTISGGSAVILITAFDDSEALIRAGEAGGFFAYVRKTPELANDVRFYVRKALDTVADVREKDALQRDAATRNSLENIKGNSPAIEALRERIRAIAPTSSTVLITGESGTGKELVARGVHSCSPRSRKPFVSINCGAFPETLLESELFGYVKGAFTGANQNRIGLFETANGGTIFLDEIAEMTPMMQVKLLRVLQERTVRPVGATSEKAIDVRVIAATNRNLPERIASGEFREDLFYRLNVVPIAVPPLRDRRQDIEILANHFLKKYAPAAGKQLSNITQGSMVALSEYSWPGNVRQLENIIERAVALAMKGGELEVEVPTDTIKAMAAVAGADGSAVLTLPPAEANFPIPHGFDMEAYVANLEKRILKAALHESKDVQTRAAGLLNLSYRSFRHLLKKYEL